MDTHIQKNCSSQCRPSGLQVCTHPRKGKRKERAMREKEREGSTKGKRVLYKTLQIPTLPPKWPIPFSVFICISEQIYFDKFVHSSNLHFQFERRLATQKRPITDVKFFEKTIFVWNKEKIYQMTLCSYARPSLRTFWMRSTHNFFLSFFLSNVKTS